MIRQNISDPDLQHWQTHQNRWNRRTCYTLVFRFLLTLPRQLHIWRVGCRTRSEGWRGWRISSPSSPQSRWPGLTLLQPLSKFKRHFNPDVTVYCDILIVLIFINHTKCPAAFAVRTISVRESSVVVDTDPNRIRIQQLCGSGSLFRIRIRFHTSKSSSRKKKW